VHGMGYDPRPISVVTIQGRTGTPSEKIIIKGNTNHTERRLLRSRQPEPI
jgi:hypothetical protein